jgi:hypothetical protein
VPDELFVNAPFYCLFYLFLFFVLFSP